MTEHHSTPPDDQSKPTTGKPEKPYPDFPLYAHAAGYWAKTIRGQKHYFGPWHDPQGALTKYNEQKDDLHAGRRPKDSASAADVKEVVNAFLNHKKRLVDAGELAQRTWDSYKDATDEIVAAFRKRRLLDDLDAEDFEELRTKLAKRYGVVRLGNTIQVIRSVFKYGFETGLIDRPMRFGPGFKRPSKKVLRLHRAKQGSKLFTANEIRRLLDAAGLPMKAMVLLAVNCGFGNADCGRLPLTAVDLNVGWIDYPRPKTGIARRCPLWPETVQALRNALEKRPTPKGKADADLFFVTKYGHGWGQEDSSVTHETRKLLDSLEINGNRSFYALRHTFRTVADEAKDQPAADYLMGHARDDMASIYRERIDDSRLLAVSNHVRAWVFGAGPAAAMADEQPKLNLIAE